MKQGLQWTTTSNDCQTIFYPGMSCSQSQAAKYMGQRGFISTTNEHVKCTASTIDVIHKIYPTKINEVEFNKSYCSLLNPITSAYAILSYFSNWKNGISVMPLKHSNKPSLGTVKYHTVNYDKISIGQKNDITSHFENFNKWNLDSTASSFAILYGVSRGAATTFNALTCNEYDTSKIKLVILEGCPDNINELLQYRYGDTLGKFAGKFVLPNITSYNPDYPSPSDRIANFPANVPVIFISSKADHQVPLKFTKKIAEDLSKRKKNDVYFLELEQSSHPNYMFDDKKDARDYQTMIHAAYKKYDLAHIPALAEQGEELLERSLLSNKIT